MKLLFSLISHLKSETDSTDTVSHLSPAFYTVLFIIVPLDWAYVEDWCRRLTGSFKDVYVFTIPLYLPRREADGKWRVVSRYSNNLKATLKLSSWQTHEVIGSPPNVSVPTHFAKVVLASKPSSPSSPDILELSTGAFVLPNAVISDDAPLESFIVPGMCLFEG